MGVLAEISECALRTAEGAFGINHPWGAEQGTKPCGEGLRILQHREGSVEVEFVLRMQSSGAFYELAPKYFFEHVYWQEELLLRVDPPRVVRSQTAGGNHTMNMRMSLKFLVPGSKTSMSGWVVEDSRVQLDIRIICICIQPVSTRFTTPPRDRSNGRPARWDVTTTAIRCPPTI